MARLDNRARFPYTDFCMKKETGSKVIKSHSGLADHAAGGENYHSPLIDEIKAAGFSRRVGAVEICLAREFGFCYGVDRAVRIAYETRKRFPDKTIYLVSEIIHNPMVNGKLRELGVRFLNDPDESGKRANDLKQIHAEDVVLIPAFGVPADMLETLKAIGCLLVDTTCGSVVAVWNRVEEYARDGFTALIHGKFNHEETRATCSRVAHYPAGRYVVVGGLEQAGQVRDYILRGGNGNDFLKEFRDAVSSGFDPDKDLQRIGCANQTTMLSEESLAIADMIRGAMVERYGREKIDKHFRHFETICKATQERQDAVLELAQGGMDLILVVGGYNSSNTAHLCEIANHICPAYHICDAAEIISRNEIRHKSASSKEIVISSAWLPNEIKKVGITGGASTPDRVIEQVIKRIESLLK